MNITLLVNGARQPVEITEEGITLGRGEAASVRVASNAVSRVHARIFLKEGRPHVTDLQSLNGTSVNGELLSGPAPIKEGDTITLGEIPVQWVGEEGSGANLGAVSVKGAGGPAWVSLEDRPLDASGSIMIPHASIEKMLAQQQAVEGTNAAELYQKLATMASTLLRAAGLSELLESVMGLVRERIPCQRGFILLVNPGGDLVPEHIWEEKPGAITSPISRTIAWTAMKERVTILTTDARIDPRFAAGDSIKIHGITSALCAPLIVEDASLGVVYLESSLSKGGFKPEHEHLLSFMANFAAVGIAREREARFRQRLERYHSPQVVDQILKSSQAIDGAILQAQRSEISVLFADISGFTRLSEGMEPLQLAAILNRTFEVLTDQVFYRGGTLDKYIGDAVMAFFGAPNPDPGHAAHAVEAAIAMQEELKLLNQNRPAGYPELRMRIGVNSGDAFAGDIGCEKRMDYTVMGSTVNMASRLESSVAKPGQIVVGPRTAELLERAGMRRLDAVTLRGFEQEIRPWEVMWDGAPTKTVSGS